MNIKDYKFNVGDDVITIDGIKGKIVDICTCEQCEERGFHEPIWTSEDHGEDYITICDAQNGFNKYYQIGKYHFNDFDKDEVLWEIDYCNRKLKILEKQLKVIEKYLACKDCHEWCCTMCKHFE